MKKKIVTLLKMLALSFALIAVYRVVDDRDSGKENEDASASLYGDGAYTTYDFAMGTSVCISIFDKDETAGECSRALFEKIKELDENVISWRSQDSELYRLNNDYVPGERYNVSDVLAQALQEAYQICKDSEGALDITIRPLAQVWNIEEADSQSFQIPDTLKIEDAMKHVGYENVSLSDNDVIIGKPDVIIDLGAVGKGYALDIVREELKKSRPDGAMVSVGGSVLVYGKKSDSSDWKIGIRDPRGNIDDMIGYLSFPAGSDICISTSGDYEKFFMVDGMRYHHILSRETGYPADTGLSSVTVVCENGLYSDALSTTCFILGYERSLPLLEKYDAGAVFIDKNNKITITDGLKSAFYEE